MRRLWRILRATLREIFEENAYERFLLQHQLANSREAYAHYLRETNGRRERRVRCC